MTVTLRVSLARRYKMLGAILVLLQALLLSHPYLAPALVPLIQPTTPRRWRTPHLSPLQPRDSSKLATTRVSVRCEPIFFHVCAAGGLWDSWQTPKSRLSLGWGLILTLVVKWPRMLNRTTTQKNRRSEHLNTTSET